MSKVYSKGTLLKVETASSTFTTIAHRVSIDGPQSTVTEVDVVDLDSVIVETLPGLPDPGSVSFTCWMHDGADTAQDLMFTLSQTPAIKNWQLIFPLTAAVTLAFAGYVTAWSPTGLEANNYAQFSCTVRITSTITRTVAGA